MEGKRNHGSQDGVQTLGLFGFFIVCFCNFFFIYFLNFSHPCLCNVTLHLMKKFREIKIMHIILCYSGWLVVSSNKGVLLYM